MNTEAESYEAKQKEYEAELIAFIRKNKIMRWAHITWNALSFSKRTAYNYQLHHLQSIKDAMEENRSFGMNYLLQKWIASDNATLQIAAMRIIADSETHQLLNQSYIDHTSKGKEIHSAPIIITSKGELPDVE